ncbi:unnamed protein product, partial [Mesorhabditis spiculigera]
MDFLFFVVLISLASASTVLNGADRQVSRFMTIDLDSKLTCYYEPLEPGMNVRLNLRTYRSETHQLQLRFSSPSGELSDWQSGQGLVHAYYNVTEIGDYEICIHSATPTRVSLHIYFFDPAHIEAELAKWLEEHELSNNVQEIVKTLVHNLYKIKYAIKYYNQVTGRDQEMQQSNSDNISNYSIAFSCVAVIMAFVQVYLVRRMFFVDQKRIRI